MTDRKQPASRYPVEPQQVSAEHHVRCPICGHMVDELDLEEVIPHLDPDHEAPKKN